MRQLNTPEVLTSQQLKNVLGGSGSPTTRKTCGVKVDGAWYQYGTQQLSEGAVGHTVIYGGAPIGTATNWCCASCPW